jgi:hypothetical protein
MTLFAAFACLMLVYAGLVSVTSSFSPRDRNERRALRRRHGHG